MSNLHLVSSTQSAPDHKGGPGKTVVPFLTAAQIERRDSHLSITAKYRAKLRCSTFELAREARTQYQNLISIHEDLAHERQIDSPVAVTRPAARPKRRLRLVLFGIA